MGRPLVIKVKRPLRITGEEVEIPLTRGHVAVVDLTDLPLVEGKNWYAAERHAGLVYAASWVDGREVFLHRHLMGDPKGMEIDHRDGDGLNCRRSNIREATSGQNKVNRHRVSASGYRGVQRSPGCARWIARIRSDGKQQHLGSFSNPEAAARAYDAAAVRMHGEFAILNFGGAA